MKPDQSHSLKDIEYQERLICSPVVSISCFVRYIRNNAEILFSTGMKVHDPRHEI